MNSVNNILVINAGSSSLKFAIYASEEISMPILWGSITNIGSENVLHSFTDSTGKQQRQITIEISNINEAAVYLLNWLELQVDFSLVTAVGHRLVYGMGHAEAEKITDSLLNGLKQIQVYDPEHLPGEIKLIEIFAKRHPGLVQVACFDTSFHNTIPKIAKLLPIPRRYFDKGIYRYGFHGLSYKYLMQELNSSAGKAVAKGKIILAHLGNGASIAAVKNGKCQDTSMGFTPAAGLVMGTRSGDIDPGVALYLMEVEKLNINQFNHLINYESGMLGISGTTSDMKELIKNKNTDAYAAEAFELFCYQAKKFIGAYTAVLEGVDTLIFSGGIGEHSPEVRSQICDGLEFLGIELDEVKNMNNEAIISAVSSKVSVRVTPSNEQLMIARLVYDVIHNLT